MSTRTARSVDRTVEKMLRCSAKASVVNHGTGGTASTAAQALDHFSEIQKRIARGDLTGAESLVERLKGNASGPQTQGKQQKQSSSSLRSFAMLVAGGIVAASVVGGFLVQATARRSHSVSGTLTLDRNALSNVDLAFQRHGTGHDPIRVTTGSDGSFTIESIQAGEYAVFLSPSEPGVKLPKKYFSPQTTPFRIHVSQDLSGLRMVALSEKKRHGR
ncbi:MAG: hypothetical protein ACKOYJ_01665 [Planctomycetia bacterium]